jgi:hypothetical protein
MSCPETQPTLLEGIRHEERTIELVLSCVFTPTAGDGPFRLLPAGGGLTRR